MVIGSNLVAGDGDRSSALSSTAPCRVGPSGSEVGAVVIGIPIDDITLDETVDHICDLVEDGRRTGRTHQVATVNVDFVVNALFDSTLRGVLRRASLSIPDGMPIVWGSRILGTPVRERVAGADLVPALGARAARDGLRIALFGAAPGVARQAADRLRSANPGLDVVADAGPSFASMDDLSARDLDWLVSQRPDICCVAFGNPKQELFIHEFGEALGIPVMIGVGGTLDFVVGTQQRAPKWMQRCGLEWVHRLVSDPRRLAKRYLRDARVFIPALLRQAWTGRARTRRGEVCVRTDGGDVVIDLSDVGSFDNRTAAEFVTVIRGMRRIGRHVEVVGIDSHAVESSAGLAEWVDDFRPRQRRESRDAT